MPSTVRLDISVDPARVHPSARILGDCFLTGPLTRVGAGAVVENSYLENAVVEDGARVADSVLISTGKVHKHKCDAAGRWVSGGAETCAGAWAEVKRSVVMDSALGKGTRCADTSLEQCSIGPGCALRMAKAVLVTAGEAVTIHGPTEISEAWLGHHLTIDECGYFEGVFSNEFHVLDFDRQAGRLRVVETLDLPHLSRYGMNSIFSTNSGKLLPMPDGRLASLGPPVRLWHDNLLSHEPIMLGPCCWVSGWTKVVGQSGKPHATAEELLADAYATHLMPFSINGLDGETVWGQTLPGERCDGPGHKRRSPAWAFIHAPAAVIAMVRRLHAALPAEKLGAADSIVTLSLRNALAVVRAMAHERDIDIDAAPGRAAHGWKGWLIEAKTVIDALLASNIWEFRGGEPLNWRESDGRWTPADPDLLRKIAPDALEDQVSEEEILDAGHPRLEHHLGVTAAEMEHAKPFISPESKVAPDAWIGPGSHIAGKSIVGAGARIWRTTIYDSRIAAGAKVLRSLVRQSDIDKGAVVISSHVRDSILGAGSAAVCARVDRSRLAGPATVSPFGDVRNVDAEAPIIAGGCMDGARIRTPLMSMHMAGVATHIRAEPCRVDVGGKIVEIWSPPMLGGGSRILGSAERPVGMEGSFIGSNAIVEPGAYVGFGSFVLGLLTGEEGLPPFTVSTGPGPEGDGIGQVLAQFPSLIITHIIGWTYQASGAERAPAVAGLMRSQIEESARAAEWALQCRAAGKWDESSPYARYKSLRLYSKEQLQAGVEAYRGQLADDRWKMEFVGGELRFAVGTWAVAEGAARWGG
jgi:UDP-3-O-[3-hydroxymyristoyl] glucosamine N-acyltransferase